VIEVAVRNPHDARVLVFFSRAKENFGYNHSTDFRLEKRERHLFMANTKGNQYPAWLVSVNGEIQAVGTEGKVKTLSDSDFAYDLGISDDGTVWVVSTVPDPDGGGAKIFWGTRRRKVERNQHSESRRCNHYRNRTGRLFLHDVGRGPLGVSDRRESPSAKQLSVGSGGDRLRHNRNSLGSFSGQGGRSCDAALRVLGTESVHIQTISR
jgi:hypothetical protein